MLTNLFIKTKQTVVTKVARTALYEKRIYDFAGYKQYLAYEIERHRDVHGYRTQLAAAAGCQRSFFSQALNSHVHLTPEHGYALAKYFGMDDDERAYLVDLMIADRAGTAELREFQLKKLAKAKARYLGNRHGSRRYSTADQSAVYYASWLPSAVHILLTIPAYRKPPAIARRLGIREDQALTTLRSLERIGFAAQEGEEWRPILKSLHLPKDSPFIVASHRNWREIALQESSAPRSDSMHYTAVHSLSRADYRKLTDLLQTFLDDVRERVSASPEEELCVFLCDFFLLDRR